MDTRENLDAVTGSRALRVLVDGEARATGIELPRGDGSVATLQATGEVVLCCGAIDTPRLLLGSGIGAGDQLRGHGIAVVADVPGVGETSATTPRGSSSGRPRGRSHRCRPPTGT